MPHMKSHRHACMLAARGAAATCVALTAMQARADSAMCPLPQRALFSCGVGAKEVAVCASGELSETTGSVQYRYGRPSHVELNHPAAGSDWRAVTSGGTMVFSGGGGAFLAFERRPYRYIVYTAVGQGWGSKSGVVVERSGKRIANLICTARTSSELGPDLFTLGGIRPFEDSFELP